MVVKTDELLVFLRYCAEQKLGNFEEIIVPARTSGQPDGPYFFDNILTKKEVLLDGCRTTDPAKMLFYLFREQVLNKQYPDKQRILAGVKACDLKALSVLDKALINEDFIDPAYKHWRDHTLIISNDCTTLNNTCHCNLTGGQPYADKGFDLNLSRIRDSYFITVGSEKGQMLAELLSEHISVNDAPDGAGEQVEQNRGQIYENLLQQNKSFGHAPNYASIKLPAEKQWDEKSAACVGCGSCTNICPTCYCIILNDESKAAQFVKVRSSDSCQLNGYAAVAGGGTPRPRMTQRFRNRYLCKFQFMDSNFAEIGCSGCGRCIEACPAEIDIRQVVQQMIHQTSEVKKTAPVAKNQLIREEV